jgi:pimeloyl-ACP methyl ester carboxylesterase
MIPGISDGMRTVEGLALPFSLAYHRYARNFRVFAMSRRRNIPEGYAIRDMARDVLSAMDEIGIGQSGPVDVLGVSQGGMISQELALTAPERVRRLVLAVTMPRPNPTVNDVLTRWIRMAEEGDMVSLMTDTAERTFIGDHVAAYKAAYGLYGRFNEKIPGGVRGPERFIREAKACLGHDAWDRLPGLKMPVLVLGGTEDRIVSGEASRELASRIPDALLHMFEGYSHGAFEQAADFHEWILDFFTAPDESVRNMLKFRGPEQEKTPFPF